MLRWGTCTFYTRSKLVILSGLIPSPRLRSHHAQPAYILTILQEDREVVIPTQGGMGCQALQEDFMHCNSLLKNGQVLPVGEWTA